MIKGGLSALIIILLGLNATVCDAKQKTEQNTMLERSDWQTYCTGRYLVDLPSALNPEYAGGDSLYGANIIWDKQFINRKQVLAQIEQMKKNLSNLLQADKPQFTLLPRKDGKPYFVRQIDYPNGGIGILVRATSRGSNSYELYNYFITEKPFRIFKYHYSNVFDSNMEAVLQKNHDLARALQSRELHEIPKGPGLCIYGGFVAGNQSDFGEQTGIKLNYPYYSKDYYFQIGIGNLVVGQSMTVHPKKKQSSTPRITNVFRDSYDKRVAGLKGMEYVFIRRNEWDPNIPLYDFTWHYPGQENSSQDPHVAIFMGYVVRGISPTSARVFPEYLQFTNSNDALALWDKILNSVRRRPE